MRKNSADTADLIAFRRNGGRIQVLNITRGDQPFKGHRALPGGYRDPGETSRQAAEREAFEETGLRVQLTERNFVGRYDRPGRDPRGPVVSDAYALLLTRPVSVRAGDDAATVEWTDIDQALCEGWAFDHAEILADAHAKLRAGRLG